MSATPLAAPASNSSSWPASPPQPRQGGWNDDFEFPESITDEIAQAFRNVEQILALAGATWEHVISIVSYHVSLDGHQDQINQAMTGEFQRHRPGRFPTWTCLGVAALGDPRMRVEVRASAVLPD
jgi:enamine deaminase RidA (YjgF/YER057c/UK114 family)